ncbi:MAG: sigma-54 dependent transcriptional regulator [Nitrospirota bacterium]
MGKVLIVEDYEDLRLLLSNIVKEEGYSVSDASNGSDALKILNSQIIDLVFLDLGLPDIHGIELLHKIKDMSSDTDIVVITGMNDACIAVTALKSGAINYMLKPFNVIEFRKTLNMIMKSRLYLKKSMIESDDKGIDSIIGEYSKILALKQEIKMAADVRVPVLIEGETGTGKELVARAIHHLSENKSGIFVKVDCGTLSVNIIESELFGHEKGAFTDAKMDKKGLVEMADGGTLFLDEIGNLPYELQPKLLRLIEESAFRRVGGVKDIRADLRIIAATNLNLKDEIGKGRFRDDFYYRLKVMSLKVPSLRERGNDVLLLAYFFLRKLTQEMKKIIKGFTPEAEKTLLNYDWLGNIRELRNCIERAIIYCRSDWINPSDLNLNQTVAAAKECHGELVTLEEMERRYIKKVFSSAGGNKTEAARILGISRTTLREKLRDG